MMLYKNTKVKVCSPGGDTDYFDIVAGVPQGDTLAPYLFIICRECLLIKGKVAVSSRQKKEAEGTPDKYLRTRTTVMT